MSDNNKLPHQIILSDSEDSESIHNPHDKMLFASLKNHDVARDAIKNYLPLELVQRLELMRMKPYKTKLVSPQMKEFQADVFYEIPFIDSDESAFILFHCEQESHPKRTISLRVWQYLFLALMEYAENHPGLPLPVPYPLILYTGEAKFTHSTNMFDLFGVHGELAKKHFLEGVHLVDVCRLDDDDIKKHELFGLTELAFKYKKTKDFESFLETAIPWLHRVEVEIGSDYAIIFIKYIVEAFQDGDFKTFDEKTKQYLSEKLEKEKMTIAQQLELRGEQLGEQRGRLNAIREMATKLWKKGFEKDEILRLTDLDLKELEDLLKEGMTTD